MILFPMQLYPNFLGGDMGTGGKMREVRILLHEDRTGPGLLFSFEASNRGRGVWFITKNTVEQVPDVSLLDQDPSLAVINDSGAERLILEFLGEEFGSDFATHVFTVLASRCSEHGVHLKLPAEVSD